MQSLIFHLRRSFYWEQFKPACHRGQLRKGQRREFSQELILLIWSRACSLGLVSVCNLGSFIRSGRNVEKKKTRHVITQCIWDHLNEEKVRKLWAQRGREDFTVTFNEDPTEAGNSPWQSSHSCQASGRHRRVLGTTGDLYSGSSSQIYNHAWNGLIVRDGTGLSISSAVCWNCTREFCYFLQFHRGPEV